MATITVPGAHSTIVGNNFTTPANTALAQSIATTLNGLLASGTLNVASVAGGGVAPPPPGSPPPFASQELEITSGGVVNVPLGYGFLVDGSMNANLTVTGGPSFFGGGGNINYTNTSVGSASITAGNGSDTFNLSGNYAVAAGDGFDHYNLSGTGQVSLGGGSNLVTITGGADTVFAGATPGPTGIIGGSGAVFFYANNSPTQALNVITGGTQGATVVGAANNVLVYNSPSTGGADNPGALLVAGLGNETLFGAPSQTNDQIYGSFTGGNDVLFAGTGKDHLVAGSGQTSLIGGTGQDTFEVVNSQLLSAITKTAVTPGVDFLYNTRAGETLALSGFDTLYGAANSDAAANAVKSAIAGGSSAVTLKDGTQITFASPTGANGISIISS